jgi:hypothetical protein
MRKAAPFALPLALLPVLACTRAPEGPGALSFEVVPADMSGLTAPIVSGDPRRWYIPESNGSGAAWIDYDCDGDFDLFVGNGCNVEYVDDGKVFKILRNATSHLYQNNLHFRFRDVTAEAGVGCTEWVNGVATGDIDGDGDPDLYLANFGRDVLYRNAGGPGATAFRFVDATEESGIHNLRWAASAAFGDLDNDGDLDLYVANYVEFDPANPPAGGKRNVIGGVEVGWGPEKENPGINLGAPDVYYRNDGNGKFADATRESGFELKKPLCSYAVVFSDVDHDGWQDVLVANDGQPANLFMNRKNGTFAEEGEARGFAFDANGKPTAAMGLSVEDYDFDGDMDVFRTNFQLEANSLHVNDGKGYFTDRAAEAGLAATSVDRLGWACAFVDFENDGIPDLVVANGHVYPQAELIHFGTFLQPMQFYHGRETSPGKVVFDDITQQFDPSIRDAVAGRSLALCDLDLDGALDFVLTMIDLPPRLVRNRTPHRGAWISISLRGSRANRDGYGARVAVTCGGRTWTKEMRTTQGLYSSNAPRLHFGLGDVRQIDRIAVEWPGGTRQEIGPVAIDQFLMIREEDAARK